MDSSAGTVRRVGELVGLLHALPAASGAVSRPAGGWHHLSIAGGGRRADVAALKPVMERAATRVPKDELGLFRQLLDELDAVDGCEDLPHALINCDFGGPNVIIAPDGSLSAVDWAGSGRGPRVHSINAMSSGDLDTVDAFVAGYREHATLEDAELDRLADALPVHSLVLDCWCFAFAGQPLAQIAAGRPAVRDHAKRVADRARHAFHA
jgi:Ser/Thr protein kinase RdoA (MazF antagonist)